VLSADILNHFAVKNIKFFACLSEFFVFIWFSLEKPKICSDRTGDRYRF